MRSDITIQGKIARGARPAGFDLGEERGGFKGDAASGGGRTVPILIHSISLSTHGTPNGSVTRYRTEFFYGN